MSEPALRLIDKKSGPYADVTIDGRAYRVVPDATAAHGYRVYSMVENPRTGGIDSREEVPPTWSALMEALSGLPRPERRHVRTKGEL